MSPTALRKPLAAILTTSCARASAYALPHSSLRLHPRRLHTRPHLCARHRKPAKPQQPPPSQSQSQSQPQPQPSPSTRSNPQPLAYQTPPRSRSTRTPSSPSSGSSGSSSSSSDKNANASSSQARWKGLPYKYVERRVLAIMVSLPFVIVLSYHLYQRVVHSAQRRRLPRPGDPDFKDGTLLGQVVLVSGQDRER